MMMSTLEHFLTEIGLPEAGRDCVLSPALPQERLQTLCSLLEQDEEACLQALKTETEPNGAALCLFSLYAFSQREAWLARGISEQIYLDTMRDLTIWYQACMQKTGRPGVMEWDWLLNSLKGRLVRLGRLQYEPGDLEEAIRTDEYSFPKGVRKLEIHIPADGKLEPEQISSSLSQARIFFAGNEYRLMHCHSWLLSPALHRILPPSSNILNFQSFFRVYGEDFSYRQAEERVFGEISDRTECYPEHTSLQKSLKAFLLTGGRVGMGMGVIPFSEEKH